MSNRRNLRHTENKLRDAINSMFETFREENLRDHGSACKALEGYQPVKFTIDGNQIEAIPGPAIAEELERSGVMGTR